MKLNHDMPVKSAIYCEPEEDFKYSMPHHFSVFDTSGKQNAYTGYVDFQEGPVNAAGRNGLRDEELLFMIKTRLQYAMMVPGYDTIENKIAYESISKAIEALSERTKDRQRRGVESSDRP